jgi:hypothetical protein
MRRPGTVGAILLLVGGTMVGTLRASAQVAGAPQAGCSSFIWTPPETLRTARREMVYVERPEIVGVAGGLLLIGSPTDAVDSLGIYQAYQRGPGVYSSTYAGVLIRPNRVAELVPLPSSTPAMRSPRAARTASRDADVLWAPDDTSRGTAADIRPLVMHARFDGRRWVRQDTLAARETLWDPASPTKIVEHGSARYALVPLSMSSGDSVLLLRGRPEGWDARPVKVSADQVWYARLAPGERPADLVLAYLRPTPDGALTVMVKRSTDAGIHWSSEQRISEGPGTAYDPQLIRAGASLALVWAERRDNVQEMVRLATSADMGRTWRLREPLRIDGGFVGLDATADRFANIHVVVRHGDAWSPRPLHALWSGDHWQVSPPFPQKGLSIALPVIRAVGDSVVMVWSDVSLRAAEEFLRSTDQAPRWTAPPVALLSIGRPSCKRSP